MLKGYVLIFRNAEGVHGKRKLGNPWTKLKALYTFSEVLWTLIQEKVDPQTMHN